MRRRDPLVKTPDLIRRVYAYVAYRIGEGPDAEDVTSDVFERALRYRESYDESRGDPVAWLLGIARRCIEDARLRPQADEAAPQETASPQDVEGEAIERLTLAAALARLDERSQDLVALRYGADLTARQIAATLGMKTNAVEVALHRALARLQQELETDRPPALGLAAGAPPQAARASASPGRK